MNRRAIIVGIIVSIYLCACPVSATETLPCKAGDLFVMMHIGRGDERLGDLQLFVDEQTHYTYVPADFSSPTFAWPAGKKPYQGDKIIAIRLKSTADLPALTMKVKGRFGILQFKGKRYKVDCDWRWDE